MGVLDFIVAVPGIIFYMMAGRFIFLPVLLFVEPELSSLTPVFHPHLVNSGVDCNGSVQYYKDLRKKSMLSFLLDDFEISIWPLCIIIAILLLFMAFSAIVWKRYIGLTVSIIVLIFQIVVLPWPVYYTFSIYTGCKTDGGFKYLLNYDKILISTFNSVVVQCLLMLVTIFVIRYIYKTTRGNNNTQNTGDSQELHQFMEIV